MGKITLAHVNHIYFTSTNSLLDRHVSVSNNKFLTFIGKDEVNKRLRQRFRIALGKHIEWAANFVSLVLNIIYCRLDSIKLEGFYAIIEETK